MVDSGTFDWAGSPKSFPSLAEPEPAYNNITFQETFGDLAFTTFAHAVGLRDLGCTMAPLHAYLTMNGIVTAFRSQFYLISFVPFLLFLFSFPNLFFFPFFFPGGLNNSGLC